MGNVGGWGWVWSVVVVVVVAVIQKWGCGRYDKR